MDRLITHCYRLTLKRSKLQSLRSKIRGAANGPVDLHQTSEEGASQQQSESEGATGTAQAEDSDENEVPDDLLVSGVENDKPKADNDEDDETGKRSVLRRVDSSDNDVPAEFFAEHDKLD